MEDSGELTNVPDYQKIRQTNQVSNSPGKSEHHSGNYVKCFTICILYGYANDQLNSSINNYKSDCYLCTFIPLLGLLFYSIHKRIPHLTCILDNRYENA